MEFINQYLTYEQYTELGGTLEETPFNILEAEARFIVDNYTFGRLKNLDEQVIEVKLCINALISTLQKYAENNTKYNGIKSENIDGYSVSYAGISKEFIQTQKSESKNIIDTYLSECKLTNGTPYLYMGV